MKIAEYIKKNQDAMPPELAKLLTEETSIWTNAACYGYVCMALTDAGYSKDEAFKLVHLLHSIFDEATVEEAEDFWYKF